MSDEGQPVIVGIDGSDHSIMAARWAGAVAGKLGAPLCIVHAVPDINYILSGLPTANRNPTEKMQMAAAAQASLQQSAHGVLDKADRAVRSDPRDLPVATESVAQVPGESAGEALVRLSRGARLFVIGCDDGGRAGALLVSSELLALAAHASCPVVAWRGDVVTPNDRPILVGVDDDGAAAVLPIAFEFARRFGVSLIALRAWSARHEPGDVVIPFLTDWDELGREQKDRLLAALAPWTQRYPDVAVAEVVELAKPSRSLTHHAKDAQLVFVGRSHRGMVASALLGSTNLNLLHHSPVPVAICPAPSTQA